MNKKTLISIGIIIILVTMGYLLYKVAVEEFANRSSEPYPIPEVIIEDTLKPDISQTNTTPSTTFNVSPEFSIAPPTYDRLPMYEFNPANSFTEEFANGLPSKLGLAITSTAQDPVQGLVIFASADSRTLVLYPNKGELTYTDSAPQESSSNRSFGVNPVLDVYQSASEDFIRLMGLENQRFQYSKHSYVIAEIEHVEVTTNPRNANLIELEYEAKVEDLSIIDKESSLMPNKIIVWLNSQGEIAKVLYQATGSIGNSFGNYELLTADEIRKDLQTGNTKAKLVNGTYPIGDPIESINVHRAKIAYLSVKNYLVPVYILEANVRVAGNRSGTGYLLLEAIKK